MSIPAQSRPPAATGDTEHLRQRLLADLRSGRLALPGMPELTLEIKCEMERAGCTNARLAKIIHRDPAVAARVIKVAQSAARRTGCEVTSLEAAIARLGLDLLRTLVTSLALLRMLNAVRGPYAGLVRDIYRHSVDVSAMAYVLAEDQPDLDPETAMLSGLVHDIGALPVVRYLEGDARLAADEAGVRRIVAGTHAEVGGCVLESWGLPEELARVARHHADIHAPRHGPVDYLDVIIVANLEDGAADTPPAADVDRSQVPAFDRLGITHDAPLVQCPSFSERLARARQSLTG